MQGRVVACLVGAWWLVAGAAHAQSSESFTLALHAQSTRASARLERAAWLSLSVPLERLALPRVAPALPSASEAKADAQPPAAADPKPADEPLHALAFSLEQLRAISALAQRATRVALAVAGTASERRRLDALSTRSRASALLPELRLRAQRNTDQALRWVPTTDDPYRVTQADGAGTTLEASATFRLDRLLFSREELVVERLRVQAGAERLKLERHVLEAVLAFVRARELACTEAEGETRTAQLLHLLTASAELDVLTAGWFLEQSPELGRALWGFPEAAQGVCNAPETPPPAPATIPVARLGVSG